MSKDLYDEKLVLMVGEAGLFTAACVATAKKNLPIQLGVQTQEEYDAARHAEEASGANVLYAGIITPRDDAEALLQRFDDFALNLIYIRGFRDERALANIAQRVAKTGAPFAIALAATAPLAPEIERLDAEPESRPWHYIIEAESASPIASALADLFRAAPPLAHRVVGVDVVASPLDPNLFSEAMYDLLTTFGLNFVGVHSAGDPRYVEAMTR